MKKLVIYGVSLMTAFTLNTVCFAGNQSKNNSSRFRVVFTPPAGVRQATTVGGASRSLGKCPKDVNVNEPYLTALLPNTRVGLTEKTHPTIFVYIPSTTADKGFFSIKDKEENTLYQTTINLEEKDKGGILGLKLPSNVPSLEDGKQYIWSFGLICEAQLLPDSPMIRGEIKKITSTDDGNSLTETTNSLDIVTQKAEAGIWYDTLSDLAIIQKKDKNNQNSQEIWQTFLDSQGLNSLNSKPLLKTREIISN